MNIVKMEEICQFINGGSWSEKEYVNYGIPVLKVSNCKNNKFQIEDINYLPFTLRQKYVKNKLAKGDVIIATVGSHPNLIESSAGRSVVVNSLVDGFYLNQNAVCLRTKNSDILDQVYLGYLCRERNFVHYIQNKGRGAANQMRIAISSIKEYEFNLPSIYEQRQLANILSAYDDLIENNQKQIKLLEEAAQRLYKEWFIDLRFPGHENVEIVDGIPLGWYEDTIDTKVNLLNGFAFKSKDLEETGLFKLVTIKNVQDGYFESKNVKYLSKIPDKMPKHCYLDEGDLLLSLTGNVGRVCIVEGNDFLLNQRVAKISSETPAYTYCLFRSNELFIKINNIANGAAQQNVSPIRIGQIKHLFPNDKLIMDFERVAGPILKRVVIMKKNIILLEEARDRLLPKLMNGEIEV